MLTPSLPSLARDGRIQFQCLNLFLNKKTGPQFCNSIDGVNFFLVIILFLAPLPIKAKNVCFRELKSALPPAPKLKVPVDDTPRCLNQRTFSFYTMMKKWNLFFL